MNGFAPMYGDECFSRLCHGCDMEVVEGREPEKRAQFLHNDRASRSSFVNDLYGRLIVAVKDDALIGP